MSPRTQNHPTKKHVVQKTFPDLTTHAHTPRRPLGDAAFPREVFFKKIPVASFPLLPPSSCNSLSWKRSAAWCPPSPPHSAMPGKLGREERKRRAALWRKKNEKEKKIFSLKNLNFSPYCTDSNLSALPRLYRGRQKRQRMREGEKKQDKKNIKGSSQERIKWQDIRW